MRPRTFLIFALLLSLICGTEMRSEMPVAKACETRCEKNCCAQKICCALSSGEQPQPAQAPAAPLTNLDLGLLGMESFSVLFVRPEVARRFASREPARAHALPLLAATCIRLI